MKVLARQVDNDEIKFEVIRGHFHRGFRAFESKILSLRYNMKKDLALKKCSNIGVNFALGVSSIEYCYQNL